MWASASAIAWRRVRRNESTCWPASRCCADAASLSATTAHSVKKKRMFSPEMNRTVGPNDGTSAQCRGSSRGVIGIEIGGLIRLGGPDVRRVLDGDDGRSGRSNARDAVERSRLAGGADGFVVRVVGRGATGI